MRFVSLLLLLLPGMIMAQVSVNFESGNLTGWQFSRPGSWIADSYKSISGEFSLYHSYDNTESGADIALLSISDLRPDLGETVWRFKVRYGCDPSASNRWSVLLNSDCDPERVISGEDISGFTIGVNVTGYDDTLRLWRVSDGTFTEVISSSVNWQNDIGTDSIVSVVLKRSVEGSWNLWIADNSDNLVLIGYGSDTNIFNNHFFGVIYNYTSTRDRLIWLDDISIDGVFIADTTPPTVIDARFISNRSIIIDMSEKLSGAVNSIDYFRLQPGDLKPSTVYHPGGESIGLQFPEPLQNKTNYILTIDTLMDISGNLSLNQQVDILLASPEWGDIIISEFMCDPEPPVNLEAAEYIELYNRSEYMFNTNSLSLINGTAESPLGDFELYPGSYILICSNDNFTDLPDSINKIDLANLPVLNNTGDYILLSDSLNFSLHGIDYNSTWFNNSLKSEGGWSLEIIDTDYPFSGKSNWMFSNNPDGGTPGSVNSVNKRNIDIVQPAIENIFPVSDRLITVRFSEPVTDISISPDKVIFDNLPIVAVQKVDSLRREFQIIPGESMMDGSIYTGYLNNIKDYSGNSVKNGFPRIGLPRLPAKSDLVINEVLFEPIQSEEEYIEFYNRSDKILDASQFRITSVNTLTGDTGTLKYLSDKPNCILPGDYYTVTEDKESVTARYFLSGSEQIHSVGSLPALPDGEGEILLYSANLTLIDNFKYSSDYHFDIISGTSGVSLERIDPDEATNLRSNWHSASGISGWGTPGAKNSVTPDTLHDFDSSISLSSKRITPDNDGYEDILTIVLDPGPGYWILNAIIFDDQGYRVNHLIRNSTTTGRKSIYWDGRDENGYPLREGIYIVYISGVSDSGKTILWKSVCALLRR